MQYGKTYLKKFILKLPLTRQMLWDMVDSLWRDPVTGAAAESGLGMDFTTGDPVDLGLPSTIDSNTTNALTEHSHTHALGNISVSNITNTAADEYGKLYNWWVTQEDVAPTGWHVPTKTEWETLLNEIDTYELSSYGWIVAPYLLRETGIQHWKTPNTSTNDYNFTVLGAGTREDTFYLLKEYAAFHTYTEDETEPSQNYRLEITYRGEYLENDFIAQFIPSSKSEGHSLRFIKDDSNDPGTVTDYDENIYATVKIGNQVWMAENFRGTHLNDGTPIEGPNFTDAEWVSLTTPAYCIYVQSLTDKLSDIPHNSTTGKQGGDAELDEFYHLTASQHDNILRDWIEFEFRDIEAGTAADYVLDLKALVGYTIDSATMQVDSGTLTVGVKIGSTAVTSISAVAVDTDIDTTAATGANTVAAGDKVILALSATYTGTPTLIRGKLNLTRT